MGQRAVAAPHLHSCCTAAHPTDHASIALPPCSARVGDEIGGHTVSGHVHTTAKIVKVTDTENNRRVEFQVGGQKGEERGQGEVGGQKSGLQKQQ